MHYIKERLICLFNPEIFQGARQHKSYFEGWYFKCVDHSEQFAYAIIPGMAIDEHKAGHAFIQVLDGKNKTARYYKFPLASFTFDRRIFNISIGDNKFSDAGILLTLPDFKADLSFSDNIPWPKPFYSPGIMGPFSYIPFMECYHGILSMDHSIEGIIIDGETALPFKKGRGYMEKDWGTSFPSAYVWMQSNHFSTQGVSFKCSVAKIPFMGTSFVGFIAGLWVNGKLIRFTTYNRCALLSCKIDQDDVVIEMDHPKYLLHVYVAREDGTALASPILGFMNGRIEESMIAVIKIKLLDKSNKTVIFEDSGRNAGLEVAGAIEEILK
jgi:tocopherol cyclase